MAALVRISRVRFLSPALFIVLCLLVPSIPAASGLDTESVYPRTITPNGDGINDKVFFVFENPTDAPVKGVIYDLKSGKVGEAKKTDIFAGTRTVLTWDGKDEGGAVVTGGLYLYKVEIGDKAFTGTIAVAR